MSFKYDLINNNIKIRFITNFIKFLKIKIYKIKSDLVFEI